MFFNLKRSFFVLFSFLLFAGCGRDTAVRGRVEELCRIVFVRNVPEQVCDSVVELARSLSPAARVDVLLEVLQACPNGGFLEKKRRWLAELRSVAPLGRKVEADIYAVELKHMALLSSGDVSRVNELCETLDEIESVYRLTDLQRAYYLYVKVNIHDERSLLRSWMWMKEALSLVRDEQSPRLEIRMLERFAYIADCAGDYERSLTFQEEAYRLRKTELLPVDDRKHAIKMYARHLNMNNYQEAVVWLRKALASPSELPDDKYFLLCKIADVYVRADSLPQALIALREAEREALFPFRYGGLYARMADVFSSSGRPDSAAVYFKKAVDMWMAGRSDSGSLPQGALPAYAGYAEVLWNAGQKSEAVRQLEKAVARTPHYGGFYGDVYLEPYLNVLLQLSNYYREFGAEGRAAALMFRRDSLRSRFIAADVKEQRGKITERYRNRELQAEIQVQEVQLTVRRYTLIFVSGLCAVLALLALALWVLYRQKRRRLDALFVTQKEMERLTRQPVVRAKPDSPEKALFFRLEKMVLEERLFCNPNLTLEEVCLLLGSNRSYVSACVNKSADINFSNWINRLRVNYIISAINDGQDDLNQLSAEAGFASLTSLYRYFKLFIQMTPKQYLERQRKGRASDF